MAKSKWQDINGVLLLDKPAGISSNDALQVARRVFNARKAGHGGTLDPLATGVLPLAFGQATKFISDLVDARKVYLATVRLGYTSNTGDEEGDVVEADAKNVVTTITEADILTALQSLTGEIEQMPPMYSALKHKGKPLYEYARKGKEVERQPRKITIFQLDLTDNALPAQTEITVRVACSKGTYIRVLAEDIGARLGCGAYLKRLRREAVGQFSEADAVSLDTLKSLAGKENELMTQLKPVDAMLSGLPSCEIPAELAVRFRHGQAIEVAQARFIDPPQSGSTDERCRVYAHDDFLGLAAIDNDTLAPRRLVVSDQVEPTAPA